MTIPTLLATIPTLTAAGSELRSVGCAAIRLGRQNMDLKETTAKGEEGSTKRKRLEQPVTPRALEETIWRVKANPHFFTWINPEQYAKEFVWKAQNGY